jgi:pyridoxal 5-phosphate dependent beta-lyase
VPPGGTDVFAVRAQLIERHGIVTTACGIERAPGELRDPVLRISPHIDAEPEQLEQVRVALADA